METVAVAWRAPGSRAREPAQPSESGQKALSADAIAKPSIPKAEKKAPAGSEVKLTDEHLHIGDTVTTKSGKTGVITHVHKKAGYLFIKGTTGKVYHVSWASVTHVNGKSAAEVAGKGGGKQANWAATQTTTALGEPRLEDGGLERAQQRAVAIVAGSMSDLPR